MLTILETGRYWILVRRNKRKRIKLIPYVSPFDSWCSRCYLNRDKKGNCITTTGYLPCVFYSSKYVDVNSRIYFKRDFTFIRG